MSTENIEKVEEIEEETLKRLIEEVLKNPEKYQEEAKYLLKLKLERRTQGCGYVYLYGYDFKVLGNADIVTVNYEESYDCGVREEFVVIPKTVPTILLLFQYDDEPTRKNTLTIFVFDGSSWRSMVISVPKHFRLYDLETLDSP
jgi:hypothetical protein